MKNIIALILLTCSFAVHAQTSNKYQEAMLNRDPIGLKLYLSRSLVYPDEILQQGIKGDALVMFKIDTSGFIDSITTLFATHKAIAEQAVIALQRTDGRWQPAKRNGQSVESFVYVPVKLDASKNGNGLTTETIPVAQDYHKQGLAYLKKGATKEGVHYLNMAYNLDPGNATPLYDIAQAYINTGSPDIACYYYQRLNKLVKGMSPELKQQVADAMKTKCE